MIQRDIEDAISEKILMGELEDGQKVTVDTEGDNVLDEEFTFKGEDFEQPKPAEGAEGDAAGDAAAAGAEDAEAEAPAGDDQPKFVSASDAAAGDRTETPRQ